MRILIIDDEADIGFLLSLELKLSGHEALSFATIALAQDYILLHYDSIDAIICDFQMPMMNGLEMLQWTRSKNFTGPFYILTGEPNMNIESLLNSGVTQVLFKPQDFNKLLEILKK